MSVISGKSAISAIWWGANRSGRRRAGLLGVSIVVAWACAGCGVPPSQVLDGGRAPTGVAPGPTLYFLDEEGDLVPQTRETERLGTIADALALLLTGTREPGLHSGISPVGVTRVGVTHDGDTIELHMPLAEFDVTRRGLDQIACTALAGHVQAGGSPEARVRVILTMTEPGSDAADPRTCPALP